MSVRLLGAAVWPKTVEVCANCGKPWVNHLGPAREQLRAAFPGVFRIGEDGRQYPTLDSPTVRNAVTTAACDALRREVGQPETVSAEREDAP